MTHVTFEARPQRALEASSGFLMGLEKAAAIYLGCLSGSCGDRLPAGTVCPGHQLQQSEGLDFKERPGDPDNQEW